jgi:sugar-phosphatase
MAANPTDASAVTLHAKGLLFDMDGILISSIAAVERAWTRWCVEHDVDPVSALKTIHGCRASDSLRRLRPDLDIDKETKTLEGYEIADQQGVHALPGIVELVKTLPAERWTVVTSATDPLARARLSAAGIAVPKTMVSADLVAEGKPHPAPYLAGAKTLGLRPEECVVFEDSLAGVASGRAAGCTVIATTFTHPAEKLGAADYILKDLSGMRVEADAGGLTLRFTPLGA